MYIFLNGLKCSEISRVHDFFVQIPESDLLMDMDTEYKEGVKINAVAYVDPDTDIDIIASGKVPGSYAIISKDVDHSSGVATKYSLLHLKGDDIDTIELAQDGFDEFCKSIRDLRRKGK